MGRGWSSTRTQISDDRPATTAVWSVGQGSGRTRSSRRAPSDVAAGRRRRTGMRLVLALVVGATAALAATAAPAYACSVRAAGPAQPPRSGRRSVRRAARQPPGGRRRSFALHLRSRAQRQGRARIRRSTSRAPRTAPRAGSRRRSGAESGCSSSAATGAGRAPCAGRCARRTSSPPRSRCRLRAAAARRRSSSPVASAPHGCSPSTRSDGRSRTDAVGRGAAAVGVSRRATDGGGRAAATGVEVTIRELPRAPHRPARAGGLPAGHVPDLVPLRDGGRHTAPPVPCEQRPPRERATRNG